MLRRSFMRSLFGAAFGVAAKVYAPLALAAWSAEPVEETFSIVLAIDDLGEIATTLSKVPDELVQKADRAAKWCGKNMVVTSWTNAK